MSKDKSYIVKINEEGKIKVSSRVKQLFLIITEILVFWVTGTILYNWNDLVVDNTGKAIVYMTTIFYGIIFISYAFRYFEIDKYYLNLLKSFNALWIILTIFLLVLTKDKDILQTDLEYFNPVLMSYIFFFVYGVTFYAMQSLRFT